MLLGQKSNPSSVIGTFGILFLVQGVCELAFALSMRFKDGDSYDLIARRWHWLFFHILLHHDDFKGGQSARLVKWRVFLGISDSFGGLMLLAYVILAVISWVLLRKAEVRQ